ncbi:MAG: GNAT family N-acetyltransferase [Candidatus Diapherotrites archaeon]|nr:GNAT family N-acetyltransferase [Candidatus Diapherotrites archaeon]
MEIRRAEIRDLAGIIKLGKENFPYIEHPEEFFLQRIKESNVYVLRDKRVVGFVDFRVDGDTLLIDGLVVEERYRGLGWGRKLLELALEEGKRLRLRRARLMTLETNLPARRLYESAGFRVVERRGPILFYERYL